VSVAAVLEGLWVRLGAYLRRFAGLELAVVSADLWRLIDGVAVV